MYMYVHTASSLNIIRTVKSRRISQAGGVKHVKEKRM